MTSAVDGAFHDHAGVPHEHGEGGDARFVGPVYATPAGAPAGRLTSFLVRRFGRVPTWLAPAAILCCFAGAASYVWVSDPTDSGAADLPTCLVKMTTGLDCPGCGGTRAFYYLMHANLPEAARHHVMAVFAAPFLVWIYVAWAVKRIWGRTLPMPQLWGKPLAIFVAAWGVFMVVRNIPIEPFTYLYV